MPLIPPVPREAASPEVRGVYDEFHTQMGFPAAPNFITTQGHSACAARGSWDLVRSVLVGGKIPRRVKEMMFVAISQDRNCLYCAAAHMACCRMLGVESRELEPLITNIEDMPDARTRALVQFGLKCSRNPATLNQSDFDALRQQGLGQSEMVEAIAMSALAVYANIIADATKMDADSMFATVGSPAPGAER
jgi:uncharacterized peroxidase-related enzyme